ncbi:MAG TPA: folylpolyglutamate synthase/dihydrofolate synthase family protein [Smithellaceae bacterium]|nr:folylpolyglutamate synthase/dihydrofolate synthase family protein [Smithellaceae bacterium]
MKKFNAIDYLDSLNANVMHFGLARVGDALDRLGRPHLDYPAVLIAGTNGKGSTAAMLAAMLSAAGYKTGLYTSPHLVDVRERIVIDGRKISAGDFNDLVFRVRRAARLPLTYFEVLTAAAYLHFSRQRVDIAVLEVGLGGRLDATNVCRPLVSVITNIALEHTAWLGKTLSAIAREKAGIIRKDGLCLTAATQKKVLYVLETVCREKNAGLRILGVDFHVRADQDGRLTYRGSLGSLRGLEISLSGDHQRKNAALALAALEAVTASGFVAPEAAIRRGLKKTRWAGRGEILCPKPLFVLDGAHNPAGVRALCRSLGKQYAFDRLILIFAALADKDYPSMLARIAPEAHRIYLPRLSVSRAVSPEHLADILRSMKKKPVIVETTGQAMKQAFARAGRGDLIVAAGSLYLAGDIKQTFSQMHLCGKAKRAK